MNIDQDESDHSRQAAVAKINEVVEVIDLSSDDDEDPRTGQHKPEGKAMHTPRAMNGDVHLEQREPAPATMNGVLQPEQRQPAHTAMNGVLRPEQHGPEHAATNGRVPFGAPVAVALYRPSRRNPRAIHAVAHVTLETAGLLQQRGLPSVEDGADF